jgi:DNA-directed RNA polymerase subunit RPC12/RpoP
MLPRNRYRQCPSCGSAAVRTSEVHPWMDSIRTRIWMKLSFQRPYRCMDCDERFIDSRFKRKAEDLGRAA